MPPHLNYPPLPPHLCAPQSIQMKDSQPGAGVARQGTVTPHRGRAQALVGYTGVCLPALCLAWGRGVISPELSFSICTMQIPSTSRMKNSLSSMPSA